MTQFWIFTSNSISDTVKRGILGEWYLSRQTVERYDIDVRAGDKAIIYQPAEIRNTPQKCGFNYIGSFTIDTEPYVPTRGEDYYALKICDFLLWHPFVSKNEEHQLRTNIPTGSEFGLLITRQVIIQINGDDYEQIIGLYAQKLEQSIAE